MIREQFGKLCFLREFHKHGKFSSGCTTRRLRLSRCASTIQIVRAWNQSLRRSRNSNRLCLRLSAIISQYFNATALY